MAIAPIVVSGVVLAFVLLTLWSSVHTVQEGEVEILLVFGEARQILEPGLYFVPPFVSATYPIDLRTMQYETSRGQRSIPSAFRDELERIAADRVDAGEIRT